MTYKPEQIPVGYLIYQAQRAIHQAVNQTFCEEEIPLVVEQWPVLMEVFNSNGVSQQQIANKTRKDKTTVTRLIRTLEKNGLVECRADMLDKRKKLVFHTEKAKEVKRRSQKVLDDINRHVMKNVEKRNERVFREVLETIFKNLEWDFEFMNIRNGN